MIGVAGQHDAVGRDMAVRGIHAGPGTMLDMGNRGLFENANAQGLGSPCLADAKIQ